MGATWIRLGKRVKRIGICAVERRAQSQTEGEQALVQARCVWVRKAAAEMVDGEREGEVRSETG